MKVDPITLEVIRNRLIAASRDIRRTVERAAYSPVLYEVVDFSCGILDSEANLVAETPGLPIFLANLSDAVNATYATIGRENLLPGDIILCNDPYNGGGTHCPDIVVLCPTFFEGEIRGWAAFRGHTVDMGGIYPGGWYSNTTEIFQEGFRLPPVKLVVGGRPNEDVLRLIRANTRVPDAVLGDIRAMIAAVRTGSKRLGEVIERYGLGVTLGAIREILDQGERMSRAAIRRIPNGTYSAEAILDGDGNDDAPLDEKLRLKVTIVVKNEEMTIDFTGTDRQCRGPMNVPLPSTISSARYGFKIVTTPHLPNNEGFFRPLKIIVPEGSFLNPRFPAATAMWPAPTTTIPDVILKVLAPAIPDRVRAGHFGDSMADFIYGTDPRTGKYYVCAEPDGGGYGGKPYEDGESALFSMDLGDTYNVPAEVAEVRYPWRVERFELIQDSGGPGKFRGGLGVRRDYRIIGHKAGLTVTTDRVNYTPPWGLFGGKEAKTNITVVYRRDGREERWRKVSNLPLEPDDVVSFQTGGGGGYGSPLERDPQLVLQDVINGYVSLAAAKAEYGVVLDGQPPKIDLDATKQLRRQMRERSGK
ncbi:MAG: hydantoinase B/oxoprolinase family protein [Candidatus Acetothermia bacterium]|nr:hydantoinase B/oxoprolinase family protein [Candidatus Acetothermia bacterium]MDH7505450.1 hydantoinase B/oxoprolinase family protein [Candidatus Acetothermia bacterium]